MSQEWQQAIREEVSTAGDPTFDELNNAYPLLDAFFLETLRLHPPVLENHHEVRLNVGSRNIYQSLFA